jgi:hypothetical protein
MKTMIITKTGFFVIPLIKKVPSKIQISSLIFLALTKLKTYIITKVLKIKVKCLEGVYESVISLI